MNYDQAHEQSNKTIKSIKGPIDFVNHASDEIQKSLEIAGLEIAEYLDQVESKIFKGTNKNDTHHHEDNPTHKAMFRKDYTTVIGRLLPVNPFLKGSCIKVETDITYSEEVCAFVDAIPEIGQKQYKEFVDTGLSRCKKTSTLKESDINKLRVVALFRPSLCAKVFNIERPVSLNTVQKNSKCTTVTNRIY